MYFRHRFHQNIINGFNLSFPDVQKLVIKRGVDILYVTIHRWVDMFGSTYPIYHCEVWQTLPLPEGL